MDIWGLPQPVAPRLAKQYDDLYSLGVEALTSYVRDVKAGGVVPAKQTIRMSDEEYNRFMDMVG